MSRFTPKGEIPPPPPHVGRTFLIVGSVVLAGLSGLYWSMLRDKRRQERTGTNPLYEQVMARVDTKPMTNDDVNTLPSLMSGSRSRSMESETPVRDRNVRRHIAVNDDKKAQDSAKGDTFQAPHPQRTTAGGRTYTKSADFVKNYEKKNPKAKKGMSGRIYESDD